MKSWPLRSQICSVGHPGSREILRETTVPIECYFMRAGLAVLLSACILLLVVWHLRSTRLASQPSASATSTGKSSPGTTIPTTPESAPTAVYAHNLILRKGPDFRIYVRWLRGNMVRTRRDVNPTFDDPESFFLEIKTGVIRDVTLWAIYLGPELSAPNGRKHGRFDSAVRPIAVRCPQG